MIFDFKTFKKVAYKAYKQLPDSAYGFSFNEMMDIFHRYFDLYEKTFNEVHPPINAKQIQRLMCKMRYCDNDGVPFEFEYEDYAPIIAQHFKTQYYNCDYNINHFFSGKIRALRFYEVCY